MNNTNYTVGQIVNVRGQECGIDSIYRVEIKEIYPEKRGFWGQFCGSSFCRFFLWSEIVGGDA